VSLGHSSENELVKLIRPSVRDRGRLYEIPVVSKICRKQKLDFSLFRSLLFSPLL